MTGRLEFFACLAAAAALVLAAPAPTAEGRRIALVVGNDAYPSGPLQNAANDARAMQRALAGAGFRVILAENANKVVMEQQAAEFLQSIGPGDTALFFFAGHAVQIENENLLLPVDFEPGRTVIESKFRSISLAMIFDYLKRARPGMTIVIIDACRSNPAAESHSLQAGLAIPQNAGKETYIAYSTSPNHVASDNPDGRNSWFTEALSREIDSPGLTLDDVLTRVRLKVESATGGAQTPWSQTSLTAKFYFHPPKDIEETAADSMVARWWGDAQERARLGDWPEAIDLAGRVLKQKPGGALEQAAKARLPYLEVRASATKRFAAGDYKPALADYSKALGLDPFDHQAGLEAANAALLAGELALAVPALEAVRLRGPSAEVARAESMLNALSKVEPAAEAALKRPSPPPPPIGELFPGQKFGTPDFDAGLRASRRGVALDYAAVIRQITPPPASAPAPQTEVAAATPAVTGEMVQVEIRPREHAPGRDLKVEQLGEVVFVSERPEVSILVDGKPMARKLPYAARLSAGSYDIRVLAGDQVLVQRQVVVQAGQKVEMVIK